MLAPDTVLQGRYRIKGQLGQGGMGAVYEAIDERLDTVVALKETLFADERLRKQFEREARLLARMHHPALPRVSDHFSESEGQFLVMQFIAGDDLDHMIRAKQGPFPLDQVLTWGDQLLDALDYLHTQDPPIIHRDIKPQNLKITSRGQIILLDFGLAKGQSGSVSVVTTASIFGYTPNYAPLEQIQGLGTDARSDIYALSATLYHLMTAVKPPDALTRAAALVNGQPDPLVPAHSINGAIGEEIAGVLARGMSQNRDQRFATAEGMRTALQSSGEATLTGRSEAATVIIPSKAAATSATTAGDALKPTGVLTGETTVVQLASRKGRVPGWAIAAGMIVLIGAVVGGFLAFQRNNNSVVSTQASATPEASPVASPPAQQVTSAAGDSPAGSVPSEVKKVESSSQGSDTAKKAEPSGKGTQRVVVSPTQSSAPGVPPPPRVSTPSQPDVDTDTFPAEPQGTGNSNGRRRQGGVVVRTLPDGSKIMIAPDGRRMLISPDGTRRVLRPAERRRTSP